MGTLRPIAAVAVLMSVLLLHASPVLADGKAFPSLADPTPMPDQRALIHFADGVQTLVIDTAIETNAPELAWVVPVPSVPEISACDPGVFTTLEVIFRPRVNSRTSGWWFPLLFVGLILWACAVHRNLWVALTAVVLILLVGFVFLPALGVARSSMSSTAGVDVLDRQRVGSYDVTTISSDDPSALVTWLTEHDYHIDEASTPAIKAYVDDGWVFVASRIVNDESGDEIIAPHPLAMRFPVEQPVYPMRLTGTQDEDLDVTLYVFADQGARADRFEVVRSDDVERVDERRYSRYAVLPMIVVSQAGLLELLPKCRYATRLSATLTPEQMREDVTIDLVPFVERGGMVNTEERVVSLALNTGVALFTLGIGVLILPALFGLIPRAWVVRAGAVFLVGGIVAGLVQYARHDGVSVDRHRVYDSAGQLYETYADLYGAVESEFGDPELLGADSIPEVEAFALAWLDALPEQDNALTGQPIREEASPGNYLLRRTEDRLEFLIHDVTGLGEAQPIIGD